MLPPKKHVVNNETLPIKWKKRVKSDSGDDCLGVVDDESNHMWIRKEQAPIEECDTLIHELMHIFWHTGTFRLPDDMEESTCRNFAPKFVRHIQDNPEFWEYISEKIRHAYSSGTSKPRTSTPASEALSVSATSGTEKKKPQS